MSEENNVLEFKIPEKNDNALDDKINLAIRSSIVDTFSGYIHLGQVVDHISSQVRDLSNMAPNNLELGYFAANKLLLIIKYCHLLKLPVFRERCSTYFSFNEEGGISYSFMLSSLTDERYEIIFQYMDFGKEGGLKQIEGSKPITGIDSVSNVAKTTMLPSVLARFLQEFIEDGAMDETVDLLYRETEDRYTFYRYDNKMGHPSVMAFVVLKKNFKIEVVE